MPNKVKILKSDLEVYPIGQGTLFGRSFDGQSDSELINKKKNALSYGIDLGMNFIDTGEDYEDGLSEEILGEILKKKRSKVVVGSKFKPANNGYNNVIKSVEGSLKRLKTDYIDIYQIQWPNPKVPIDETISALNRLIEQGKVRYMGVGNFSVNELKNALSHDELNKLCVIQTEYDLFNRQIEEELLNFNQENKITTIAYMSFGKNLYTNDEKEILQNISDKYKKSIRSIVLNWITSHSDVILLTSSMSKSNTLENFESLNFELDGDDIDIINKKFNRKIIKVLPNEIKVIDYDESDTAHKIYTTVEDALENKMKIEPSAKDIADEIKLKGKLLRPVELKRNPDKSSGQPYILVRGRMRFWGWIIAYGYDEPIQCKLF
tara:strand:+ start:3670 stop:4803 length:1134 start_codon:yes stop_codon:yes gene_type:complete